MGYEGGGYYPPPTRCPARPPLGPYPRGLGKSKFEKLIYDFLKMCFVYAIPNTMPKGGNGDNYFKKKVA